MRPEQFRHLCQVRDAGRLGLIHPVGLVDTVVSLLHHVEQLNKQMLDSIHAHAETMVEADALEAIALSAPAARALPLAGLPFGCVAVVMCAACEVEAKPGNRHRKNCGTGREGELVV